MLNVEHCRTRQKRLIETMRRRGLDTVVVGRPRHVYYFSGHRPFWLHECALVLSKDGRATLYAANVPAADLAADETIAFEATSMGTQRQEQLPTLAALVLSQLNRKAGTIGIDASPVTALVGAGMSQKCLDIEPDLWQLRRRKMPDELALMRKAISCTKAMYERAREIIEPGIPELRVYNELHAVAVEQAGERLDPSYLGNDYQCGSGGGPPRDRRKCEAGELYVLDLGPAYRGYFSDNCRGISVDRKPSDAQLKAWEALCGVFPILEKAAKPGVRCRDLYDAADAHLKQAIGTGMSHHLGHGVGLEPHEFPHLNPKWDDVLEVGDTFTCEPGLYGDHLRGGLRLENQYLVTPTGVENLTPFPMELA